MSRTGSRKLNHQAHTADFRAPDPRPGDGRDFGLRLSEAQNDGILAALACAHPRLAPLGLVTRLVMIGAIADPRRGAKR